MKIAHVIPLLKTGFISWFYQSIWYSQSLSTTAKKLEHNGVHGIVLKWSDMDNYLSRRQQNVDFDGIKSKTNGVTCGVLQGQILGLLLFLLVHYLSNVSSFLFSLLFANDSNMFASGNDPNELIIDSNEEIEKISIWMYIDKLTHSVKKTHFMVFRSSRRKLNMQDVLMIRGHEIETVNSPKSLGVYLDSGLTWHNHINYTKGKIACGIGILCKTRISCMRQLLLCNTTLSYILIYATVLKSGVIPIKIILGHFYDCRRGC